MQVNGLEFIKHSKVLQLFFEVSKDWMSAASTMNGNEDGGERTMRILPKTIGRNLGFIVHILSSDNTVQTTFYAKVQSVSMDTVLIHQVLKNMKCGPDVFHISLLDNAGQFSLGVITERVKDWDMVSTLTRAEQVALLKAKDGLLSTTFLLSILVELGSFGNIPNNMENWGFIDTTDNSIPYPQMSVIDFSRGCPRYNAFASEEQFRRRWEKCVETTVSKWHESIYWDSCGSQLDIYRVFTALQREMSIAEQAEHFPFLQSAEAFTALLQSACDATAQWLHAAVQSARSNSARSHGTSTTQSAYATPSTTAPLTAFQHVSRPNTTDLRDQYEENLEDYEYLVDGWNDSLQILYTWFPFPGVKCTQTIDTVKKGNSRTRNQGDIGNESHNMHDSVMIAQQRTDNLPPFNENYSFVTASALMLVKSYALKFGFIKHRSLSMEVDMCEGDVGEATERNVRYSNTVPTSFVPGCDYIGPTAVDMEGNVDTSTTSDNDNTYAVSGVDRDLPLDIVASRVVTDTNSAHRDVCAGMNEEEYRDDSSEIVQVGKKRKSKNKGRKQRKRARRQTQI